MENEDLLIDVIILPVLLYGAETWTLTSSDEQALGVFERKILRKIYGPFCDREYGAYGSVLKYSVFDGYVMLLVWITPTQFVKSSNLSQVVVVADKDGLPSFGPNSKLQQLVMYGAAT